MSDQTYPNAGPTANLSRYRTGETPMVGDVVRMNQEYIGGIRFCTAPFDSTVTAIRKESVGYLLHATGHEPCYPLRFDLISRADSPDAGKMAERMLYTGRNAAEIQAWAGRGGEFSLPADDTGMPLYVIERDDGSKVVIRPGDWVVKESDGQLACERGTKVTQPATEPVTFSQEENDISYETGVRDGYQQAVQDIDILTGGDGEYYYSTDDGGCPDAEAMKARIVERFEALKAAVERAKGGG